MNFNSDEFYSVAFYCQVMVGICHCALNHSGRFQDCIEEIAA